MVQLWFYMNSPKPRFNLVELGLVWLWWYLLGICVGTHLRSFAGFGSSLVFLVWTLDIFSSTLGHIGPFPLLGPLFGIPNIYLLCGRFICGY